MVDFLEVEFVGVLCGEVEGGVGGRRDPPGGGWAGGQVPADLRLLLRRVIQAVRPEQLVLRLGWVGGAVEPVMSLIV